MRADDCQVGGSGTSCTPCGSDAAPRFRGAAAGQPLPGALLSTRRPGGELRPQLEAAGEHHESLRWVRAL